MKILIANNCKIPVFAYGGTERVIWDLGFHLTELGHDVTYLVAKGSKCDFARVIEFDKKRNLISQIPSDFDIVHFQFNPKIDFDFPYIITEHSNHDLKFPMAKNTVFLTKNHAERHGSDQYVYNGLDWRNYGTVDFNTHRKNFHFLAKAARPDKNIKGAIDIALKSGNELDVLGGYRLNINRHFRFTFSRFIHFHGMVGGKEKFKFLNNSRGLLFPVTWHEPFGLAVTESLYFGCPVFATSYGSLMELVPPECGFLSNSCNELAEAISDSNYHYDHKYCHEFALKNFGVEQMTHGYLEKYSRIIDGEILNEKAPYLRGSRDNLPWNN